MSKQDDTIKPKGILNLKGPPLTAAQLQQFRNEWNKRTGKTSK